MDCSRLILISFWGWVIFQAFSIYMGSHCQNLNLPQMMKNEVSNSLTDIKSTHLKIAFLFWNSTIFFTLLLGGYNFGSSEQNFQLFNWFWKFGTQTNYEYDMGKLIWLFWQAWEPKQKRYAANQGSQRWKIEIAYFPRDFRALRGISRFSAIALYKRKFWFTKPPRDLIHDLKWTIGGHQQVLDITWTIG